MSSEMTMKRLCSPLYMWLMGHGRAWGWNKIKIRRDIVYSHCLETWTDGAQTNPEQGHTLESCWVSVFLYVGLLIRNSQAPLDGDIVYSSLCSLHCAFYARWWLCERVVYTIIIDGTAQKDILPSLFSNILYICATPLCWIHGPYSWTTTGLRCFGLFLFLYYKVCSTVRGTEWKKKKSSFVSNKKSYLVTPIVFLSPTLIVEPVTVLIL